jgi:RNase H-fold protein (predicted Holliday junction resolvase)
MAERILGLDIGTKRIGVAITDPLGIFFMNFASLKERETKKLKMK